MDNQFQSTELEFLNAVRESRLEIIKELSQTRPEIITMQVLEISLALLLEEDFYESTYSDDVQTKRKRQRSATALFLTSQGARKRTTCLDVLGRSDQSNSEKQRECSQNMALAMDIGQLLFEGTVETLISTVSTDRLKLFIPSQICRLIVEFTY
jgi:hypothetical protein